MKIWPVRESPAQGKRRCHRRDAKEYRGSWANAVVRVDIDYETVGQYGMLMITVSGTAVTVE
nr:heavy metal-binding domain-containing protein [Candidatus Nitrososphaera gargensis]